MGQLATAHTKSGFVVRKRRVSCWKVASHPGQLQVPSATPIGPLPQTFPAALLLPTSSVACLPCGITGNSTSETLSCPHRAQLSPALELRNSADKSSGVLPNPVLTFPNAAAAVQFPVTHYTTTLGPAVPTKPGAHRGCVRYMSGYAEFRFPCAHQNATTRRLI